MGKVILTGKLFMIFGYYLMLTPLYAQIKTFFDGDAGINIILGFITVVLLGIFMPEIMWLASKSFRGWIKQGIEDSDGQLNKSDLKDAGILYVSLWSMRIFIGFSVAKMFGIEIDTLTYLTPLFGSGGIAGLTVLKGVMGK